MRDIRSAVTGRMSACGDCPERSSLYRAWSCAECESPTWERMSPEAAKALWWRRIVKAGYPLSGTGLGLWDLWLISLVEEIENGEIEPNNR